MEAPKPETMTGANKNLVCAFIAVKAVERYTTWAEAIEDEDYDEEHAADVLADWARAFAEANLASRVHSAGERLLHWPSSNTTRSPIAPLCIS